MTLQRYGSILWKYRWLVLSCFVVVGIATYSGSMIIRPEYQSFVLIEVVIHPGNNQADYANLMASEQLVQTEVQLAVSDTVLRDVASQFRGMSSDTLASQASANPRLNTQLFEINVSDVDPNRASALANSIAAILIQQQKQAIQHDSDQAQQQLQKDLNNTRKQIDVSTVQMIDLKQHTGNEARIAVLQAQLNDLQQHYNQWETALAQLELVEAQNGNFLRIVQEAHPAASPARPNVLLNTVAGFGGGLVLGMVMALLGEQLDTRIGTLDTLVQLLGSPILGTIWYIKRARRALLLQPEPSDSNAESYRILRTNIGFASINKQIQTLLVTSAMPGDGKSMIAANLAIFMARAGKNTLLIDANLRTPRLHYLFHLPPESQGLSNVLLDLNENTPVGVDAFSLLPYVHASGVANLGLMPCGPLPPNPSELLDSKAMLRFLHVLGSSGAEIIIFDAPAICGLSDATIMASKMDGVLLIVDALHAKRSQIRQAHAALSQVGAHILGCIVNKKRGNHPAG